MIRREIALSATMLLFSAAAVAAAPQDTILLSAPAAVQSVAPPAVRQSAPAAVVVPGLELVAPDQVKLGRNIVVMVKPVSPKPDGLELVSYQWEIFPEMDDWFPWPDNSRGSFGAGLVDTEVTVVLLRSVVLSQKDDKGVVTLVQQFDKVRKTIKVGVGTPPPGPAPDPVPKPDPKPDPKPVLVPVPVELPATKYSMTNFVGQLARSMAGLDQPTKYSEATAVGINYANIARRVNNPEFADTNLTNPTVLNNATTDANRVTVPVDHQDMWRKQFFAPLMTKLTEMHNQGVLVDMDTHKEVWLEISNGLELAGQTTMVPAKMPSPQSR